MAGPSRWKDGEYMDAQLEEMTARLTALDASLRRSSPRRYRFGGRQSAPTFNCPVFLDDVPTTRGVALGECRHLLCQSCTVSFLKQECGQFAKLPLNCPVCSRPLDNERCVRALDGDVAQASFAYLVAENSFERKRFCSNTRYAVLFDWVEDPSVRGFVHEFRVYCALCNAATCVQCRGPWHEGRTCSDEAENRADLRALGDLAHRNNATIGRPVRVATRWSRRIPTDAITSSAVAVPRSATAAALHTRTLYVMLTISTGTKAAHVASSIVSRSTITFNASSRTLSPPPIGCSSMLPYRSREFLHLKPYL